VGLLADTEALEKARVALEAVRRLKGTDLDAKPALKAAVNRLADQFAGQPELVELVRDFHLINRHPAVLDYVVAHPAEPAAAEGLQTLLGTEPGLIQQGLTRSNQALPIITALGATGQREAVPLLLPTLSAAPDRPLATRRAAVRALIRTQDGAAALVRLAATNGLPEDLKPLAAIELQGVRWPAVKAEAAQVLPPPAPAAGHQHPPVGELVRQSGNVANGSKIFRRPEAACSTCHQINGDGVDFGPKLSEIGTKLGKDALYDAILEPSSGIAFGYEAWAFTLKNGDDLLGLIASETATEIALKAPGGTLTKLASSEVATREKQTQSIMPEGLAAGLTTPELIDLVEYLASLKKAATP